MANILTASEGATVLRCEVTDADMLALLPLVDDYIKGATGHDWAADSTVNPKAKAAARMLLVMWHENPGMTGIGSSLNFGLTAMLVQLEGLALRNMVFYGINGVGWIYLPGAHYGDRVESLVGIAGVTGDQSASFESVISVEGGIMQISASNLEDNAYRVNLVPLEGL